ncbi:MAG: PAS domain-containing hybrid sensor histidine kinase/response regulator [Myxococcota bacterium]
MLDPLLTQFIKHSPSIAFVKDLDGRYRQVSEAWLSAFHTTEAEVVGKTDHELFPKEEAEDFTQHDREVLASGQAHRRFELVMVGPVVRTFLSTKFPLLDATGKPAGVGGFAIDVTEQQQNAEELDRQRRFLERTQAMASIGGWEFDVGSRTLLWTSETFRIFELDPRTFTPDLETSLSFFAPEHRETVRAAHDAALGRGGAPFRLEVELVVKSGRRRVRVHAVPELTEDGHVRRLSGAIQDVTEERLTEEKLRHSSRMDAVGQLAGGVAHDFNNMLGAITAAAELLRFEPLSPSANDALNTILTASTQAAGLTRQLLAFSRKERSRRVPTDLHAVLADALIILQRTLDRRITVVVELGASRSRMLADSAQLSNAIINLALNARDAMPDGGTLTFRTVDDGPSIVRLEVRDTGVGMAPEVLTHIFDPFFTTKERGRGTGLGLATVDSAVRAHEGDIAVRSEVGEGTTFELRFPVLKDEEQKEQARARLPEARSRELLLVVDDEDLARRSMQRLLEKLGHRVLEAGDGAAALELLANEQEKPALVVLDLVMPGLSAAQTFRAAREILPGLPFLFCSGYAPEPILQSLLSEPRTAKLAKPFNAEELQSALRVLLPPPPSPSAPPPPRRSRP